MTKSVLIVDDDKKMGKLFASALEKLGCEVKTSLSSLEKYDLIFLVLNSPGHGGAGILRNTRAVNPEVPIHIATAYEKEFVIDINIMMGEDSNLSYEFLLNPISNKKIGEIARHVLNL